MASKSHACCADYKLDNGTVARGASKTLSLYRLPRTLVLHLKRFTHGERGGVKLTKPLQFDTTLRCACAL